MLAYDPSQRATAWECLQHPWITGAPADFLEGQFFRHPCHQVEPTDTAALLRPRGAPGKACMVAPTADVDILERDPHLPIFPDDSEEEDGLLQVGGGAVHSVDESWATPSDYPDSDEVVPEGGENNDADLCLTSKNDSSCTEVGNLTSIPREGRESCLCS